MHTTTNTNYEFGIPFGGAAHSDYSLCWDQDAASSDPFVVKVSSFAFNGPNAVASDLACTFGESCSVTLTGYGLSDTNRLTFKSGSDCSGATHNFVGVSQEASPHASTSVSTTSKLYDMGVPESGLSGTYSVCWKSATDGSYVDIGEIVMNGPAHASHSCVMGQACTLDVDGVGLDANSKLYIADSNSNGLA